MSQGWKQTTLGEVLAPKGYIRGPFGSALRRNELLDTGIPVYEQQHAIYGVRDFRFFISNDKFQEMKRFETKTNDLIISCSGTLGKVSIIRDEDPKGIISQALLLLRANTDVILPQYLQYFFSSKEGYDAIVSRSSGSVQVNISKRADIEKIPLLLPPINEQRTIVGTLGALDEKIANNTKINHHLEQMAQTIFKSWFVDFEPFGGVIPDGWREGTLFEIAAITMGQSPDGSSYNEESIGTVFYQGRAEFGSRFPTRRLFTTQPKRMATKGDVLMSVRAPVGDLNVAYESCCLGRGLASIQSNNGFQSFVLYTMFALKQQLDMFNGEGTVFGSINKNDMASLPVLIPSDEVLRQFEELVSPMDASIEANFAESCNLQAARDSLLPRLMSGEISVADLGDAK